MYRQTKQFLCLNEKHPTELQAHKKSNCYNKIALMFIQTIITRWPDDRKRSCKYRHVYVDRHCPRYRYVNLHFVIDVCQPSSFTRLVLNFCGDTTAKAVGGATK